MNFLIGKLKAEARVFKEFSLNARDLLKTFTFFEISAVISEIFIAVFIFSRLGGTINTALFFLATVLAIPIGFYINALLIKYLQINIKRMFIFGTIAFASAPLLLVMLPVAGGLSIMGLGGIYGFGMGMYWANRNFLTVQSTTDTNRNNFFGISQAIFIFAGVVVPALTGSILGLISQSGISEQLSYTGVMLVGLVFAFVSAYVLRDNNFKSPKIERVFLFDFSSEWHLAKWLSFFNSIKFGVMMFLPTIVIFEMVGGEAELGSVITLVSILAIFISYLAGRIISAKKRFWLVFWGSLLFTVGAFGFGLSYTLLGVTFLLIMNRVSSSFRFGGMSGIWYKIIDKHPENLRLAYLCDNELWINLGRLTGLLVFIVLLSSDIPLAQSSGLLMMFLILPEIMSIGIARYITRRDLKPISLDGLKKIRRIK